MTTTARGRQTGLLILLLASLSFSTHGKNLGVMGHVFPIGEIDMLDWIDQRLHTFEKTGELAAMKNKMQAQVKESVRRPPPVAGLSTTTAPQTYFVDPTLTLARAVKDSRGNELYPAGLRINPFDSKTWPQAERRALPPFSYSKQLVLFDGDDPRQRQWAQDYHPDQPVKWILTQGEHAKMGERLGSKVYFDQRGNLTRHFQIQHVPVIIRQAGTRWQVTEIDVSTREEH